jgi:hypothetical protein
MRHFENEKGTFKRRRRNRAHFLKKKESVIIAVKRDISLKSTDRLKLIMRRPTIPKRNEDERFRKSLN